MSKVKEILFLLLLVVIVSVGAMKCGYDMGSDGTCLTTTDTIFITDTITIKVDDQDIIRREELGERNYRVEVVDTIVRTDTIMVKDSVWVRLPIEQRVYEDSLYKAWVSGYDARLDSIRIYRPTRTITITNEKKQSPISWGMQAGVGITPKGIQPYVGVGVQVSF